MVALDQAIGAAIRMSFACTPAPVVVNYGQLVTLAPAQHPAVFVNQ